MLGLSSHSALSPRQAGCVRLVSPGWGATGDRGERVGALSASITQGLLPLSLQEQQGGDRLQRQLTVTETDVKAPTLRGTPGAPATDTFQTEMLPSPWAEPWT